MRTILVFTTKVIFTILMLTLFISVQAMDGEPDDQSIMILGTVMSSGKNPSYAIVKLGNDEPQQLHVGDSLSSNISIVKIFEDKIVVSKPNGLTDIKIGVPINSSDVTSIASSVIVDIPNNPSPTSIIPDQPEPADLGAILIPDPNGGVIEPEVSEEIAHARNCEQCDE